MVSKNNFEISTREFLKITVSVKDMVAKYKGIPLLLVIISLDFADGAPLWESWDFKMIFWYLRINLFGRDFFWKCFRIFTRTRWNRLELTKLQPLRRRCQIACWVINEKLQWHGRGTNSVGGSKYSSLQNATSCSIARSGHTFGVIHSLTFRDHNFLQTSL